MSERDYETLHEVVASPTPKGRKRSRHRKPQGLNGRARQLIKRHFPAVLRELAVLQRFFKLVRETVVDGSSPARQRARIIKFIEALHGNEEGPGAWRKRSKGGELRPSHGSGAGTTRSPLLQKKQAREEKTLLDRFGQGIEPLSSPTEKWEML